ncbi:MAG TPA: DUF3800 domain-containing protein [Armatimonadota bacterium]|nr:DUF3800 domain-containing protein [Armatimonadota bacterium]
MSTFIYSDESGVDRKSRYFVIGMLILEDRRELLDFVSDLRMRHGFVKEFHWHEMSNTRFRCYAEILQEVWSPTVRYCCICVDKRKVDVDSYFGGKRYLMYNYFTRLLFTKRLQSGLQAVCFIDFKNRERRDNGLNYLMTYVNKDLPQCLKHLQPLHSHQDDCMQVCDIITGAIRYRMEHALGNTKRGQLATILESKMADLVLRGNLDIWIWRPRPRQKGKGPLS